MHDDPTPAEIFLRVKGADCTPETIALYDVIARLMSVALQYGASLDKLGDLFTGTLKGCRLMVKPSIPMDCSIFLDVPMLSLIL